MAPAMATAYSFVKSEDADTPPHPPSDMFTTQSASERTPQTTPLVGTTEAPPLEACVTHDVFPHNVIPTLRR